jgi:hypothetical protein
MTTNIDPLRRGDGPVQQAPVSRRTGADGDFAATLGAVAGSDASAGPGDAPDAVRADMAAASRAWHSLQASGRELRFDESGSGRVHVALHQVSGERLAVLDLHDVYALIEAERRS